MIPVMQRIVDKHRGDCQSACIASLLELPYEQVPTWIAEAFDKEIALGMGMAHTTAMAELGAFKAMTAWLREKGWHLLQVGWDDLNDWRALEGVLCIASMPSQKNPGGFHAVVATWVKGSMGPEGNPDSHRLKILHDPNPQNGPYVLETVTNRTGDGPPYGLSTLPAVSPRWVEFLVPINPSPLGRPQGPDAYQPLIGHYACLNPDCRHLNARHMPLVDGSVCGKCGKSLHGDAQ